MEARIAKCAEELKQFILNSCGGMTRKPAGRLTHPYITPTSEDSPYYSDNLWDWDSWLAAIALQQAEADLGDDRFAAFERGSALNFLDFCAQDGYMPICVTPDRDLNIPGLDDLRSTNMHKPVLCQMIASIVQKDSRDLSWLRPHIPKLEAFLDRYTQEFTEPETGLYRWKDDFAVAVPQAPAAPSI